MSLFPFISNTDEVKVDDQVVLLKINDKFIVLSKVVSI